jgi:hypothetical protein
VNSTLVLPSLIQNFPRRKASDLAAPPKDKRERLISRYFSFARRIPLAFVEQIFAVTHTSFVRGLSSCYFNQFIDHFFSFVSFFVCLLNFLFRFPSDPQCRMRRR